MPQPDYGIYRIFPNGASVWLENAYDLQAARTRATELSRKSVGRSPFTTCETRRERSLR
jgi:hypothetical protein